MQRSKTSRNRDRDKNKSSRTPIETDMDIYYISIGHNPRRWFDIKDLYYIITKGDKKNPVTKEVISDLDIEKIKFHAQKYIKSDIVSKSYDILPLEERMDELELKLDKEVLNIEQFYSEFLLLREKIENIENIS